MNTSSISGIFLCCEGKKKKTIRSKIRKPQAVTVIILVTLRFLIPYLRGRLHDTGATHTGMSSSQLLYRDEILVPEQKLVPVLCKHGSATRFGMKRSLGRPEQVGHA